MTSASPQAIRFVPVYREAGEYERFENQERVQEETSVHDIVSGLFSPDVAGLVMNDLRALWHLDAIGRLNERKYNVIAILSELQQYPHAEQVQKVGLQALVNLVAAASTQDEDWRQHYSTIHFVASQAMHNHRHSTATVVYGLATLLCHGNYSGLEFEVRPFLPQHRMDMAFTVQCLDALLREYALDSSIYLQTIHLLGMLSLNTGIGSLFHDAGIYESEWPFKDYLDRSDGIRNEDGSLGYSHWALYVSLGLCNPDCREKYEDAIEYTLRHHPRYPNLVEMVHAGRVVVLQYEGDGGLLDMVADAGDVRMMRASVEAREMIAARMVELLME